MLHEPAQKTGKDPASPFKAKVGVIMFFVYATIYVGFVAINIANPKLMEKIVAGGLNLAIVYGFGLIVLAMFLALIYNSICTKKEKQLAAKDNSTEEVDQ